MGVRILHDKDNDLAAFYCSTTDVAFGPVFSAEGEHRKDPDERAEAFLRWIGSAEVPPSQWRSYEPNAVVDRGNGRDVRVLSESGLQRAYSDWLAQEATQYLRERLTELESEDERDLLPTEHEELTTLRATPQGREAAVNEKIGMAYGVPVTLTYGPTTMMTWCVCGDVFRMHGDHDAVERAHHEWETQHATCTETKREGHKVFWMSFCDNKRPKGSQFLGACLIDVTAEEANEAEIGVLLNFPFAQPDAEWSAAATSKAHRLGCNPGGEIAFAEIPPDHPMLKHYTLGVLMDRATIERIDDEIEHAGR